MQRYAHNLKTLGWSRTVLLLLIVTASLSLYCGKNGNESAKGEENGKAAAQSQSMQPLAETKRCAVCGKEIKGNTTCRVSLDMGKDLYTCCSFCAANIRKRIGEQPISIVTVDYATGEKINMHKAVFVVESDEVPCCTPSVLAFSSMEEAEKFVSEKHGRIMSYKDLLLFALKYKRNLK